MVTRNLYYSVNPTRVPTTKKASKTNIAAIEFALADCDPRDDEIAGRGQGALPSGSRLTFESREGFRAGSRRASPRHAIWYFPFRRVGGP